jgi:drug/metabolite transporter (DMT)-like permease
MERDPESEAMLPPSAFEDRPGTPLLKHPDGSPTHSAFNRGRSPAGRRTPRSSSPIAANVSEPSTPIRPPLLQRRSTFRSQSPAANARLAARKKYTYAAFFLVVSLVSFTVQTELAAYVSNNGWVKPYCMLYLTHGSWSTLWPAQLLVLRIQKPGVPWPQFWRRHVWLIRSTAQMVERRDLDLPKAYRRSPWPYLARTTAFITCALTVAGLSWYIAVHLTSSSDLTAIYNCSAFFAYAFSVPLLKERLRLDKSVAVAIAILGVLVVAYGDTREDPNDVNKTGGKRLLGNLIIGAGSVLYGLYEVLYKRYACPPEGCSPGRGMIFANAFGSCIGLFTLGVLWIPLPLLHITGIERFEIPGPGLRWPLFISIIMNATFAGSFLVLISLTNPVLSSVASLLTIFLVGFSHWFLTGEPFSAAVVIGGGLIVVAFGMLSWSTWREMQEDEARKETELSEEEDDDDETAVGSPG